MSDVKQAIIGAAEVKKAVVDSMAKGAAHTREAIETGTVRTHAALETGVAQARSALDQGTAGARAAMERGVEQATRGTEGMFKAVEEVAEFSRGNFEAIAKVTQVWSVGAQDLSRQYVAMLQGLTDHALESAKAVSATRSLKDATEVQANFARAALERVMSETARLQEAALRLSEQAAAPLTQRVTVAMDRLARPQHAA